MLSRMGRARPGGRGRIAAALVLGAVLLRVAPLALAAPDRVGGADAAYAWWRTPPEVSSAEVAAGLRIDGVPFQVREIRSALPPAAVVERWQQWWAAQSIPAIESRAVEWRVLSYRRGAALVSVQLRPAIDGGTEGYLALGTASPELPPHPRAELPIGLPAGTRVLRTLDSQDGARVATQTVVATSATARNTLDALARRARLAGWSPGPRPDVASRPAATRAEPARGLWFVRGADELAIFVQAAPAGALALVHHVRTRPSARGER